MNTNHATESNSTSNSPRNTDRFARLRLIAAAGLIALITVLLAPTNRIHRRDAHTRPQFANRPPISPTLLNEVGVQDRPVSPRDVAGWRAELAAGKAAPARAALLHDWIGEYVLTAEQQPEKALAEFERALTLVPKSDMAYGLAVYDEAVATYYEGAYQDAADRFHSLITDRDHLRGYDFNDARLWYRHAGACAGYHQARAALSIPEPPRLDPLCGAAAIAACLRGRNLPYDKALVLKAMRVTGRGSSFADVLNSGRKLGVVTRSVSLDDEGLKSVPLPIVAYVEHDHFIAVVRADKRGVSYLCSDCGPFPGGRVNLSWKQWRALDASGYIAVTRKGAASDKWLAAVLKSRSHRNVKGAPKRTWTLADLGVKVPAPTAMGRHIVAIGSQPTVCGYSPGSLHCNDIICCPDDIGGGGAAGPQANDPVNLATGEEEYRPGADMTVYNPIGPSVSWSRIYNSMRGYDLTYQVDDFGYGWSSNYSLSVYDPGVIPITRVQSASPTVLALSGSDAPAGGQLWDIIYSGSIIATASSPSGWTVLATSAGVTMTAASGAALGFGYELRGSPVASMSSFDFSVVAPTTAGQIAQGSTGYFAAAGTDSPGTGLAWDIIQGGVTVASSAQTNGWSVAYGTTYVYGLGFQVSAPLTANVVGSYEVRYASSGYGGSGSHSALFAVYIPDALPGAGAKYLVFPNGARMQFTAPSVPTVSSPTVTCGVPPGYPYAIQWDYDPSGSGYYVITDASRTRYVTTPYSFFNKKYYLAQQVDRNNNYINFSYLTGPWGALDLCAITDSYSVALLTIQRATDGSENITGVSDRYGRSVYYHCSTYSTTGVSPPFPQSWQEVDGVSRIVATGTPSPPARYALGYTDVPDPFVEGVPTLHTITVPSPTGAGTSTATINYLTDGSGFVSSLVDANGNVRSYNYVDGSHTMVTIANSIGVVAYSYTVSFDMNMNRTGMTDGTDSNYVMEADFADPNDPFRPSSETDGDGRVSQFTWDQFGHIQSSVAPNGLTSVETWSYATFALGELVNAQAGSKSPTSVTYYEPSGLVHAFTIPTPGTAGGTTTVTFTLTYDSLGQVLTQTTPGNGTSATITTSYSYTADGTYSQAEALGQPVAVMNNIGKVTHYRYDSLGRLVSAVDSLGNESDTLYNLAGQVVTVTYPATGQTGSGRAYDQSAYLYVGGPVTVSSRYDESGGLAYQSIPTYGPEGEMLAQGGSYLSSSGAYDAAYRTVSTTDGNGRQTLYWFNTAGYPSSTAYPNGDAITYSLYDGNGQLLKMIDGRGIERDLVYGDVNGDLTDIEYPSYSAQNVHITYDNYSRATSSTDGAGAYSAIYDDSNRAISVSTTYTGVPEMTVDYNYNPDGTAQSVGTPAGTYSYWYDGIGRTTGVTNPFGEISSFTYLDNDWLWKQQSGGAALAAWTYNAWGDKTDLTNKAGTGGSTLSEFGSIGYDALGDMKSITASVAGASGYSGVTSYGYDSKLQLTGESSTRFGAYTVAFAYDSAGNPTTFRGISHSFNSDNQDTGNTYDGNGNPTTYGGSTCAYDVNNCVTSFGSVMTAGYTAGGMRAWKQNSSGRTYFIYNGGAPICEIDGSGDILATNTWGPKGLISRHTSSGSVFYAFDAQGNVCQRLSSTGAVLTTHGFDAYGARNSTASTTDPYAGYGGQNGGYTDPETGLTLFSHRYYDSTTGRFVNRDPIGYSGGINVYSYCVNNPASLTDPSGLSPCWGDDDGSPRFDNCYRSDLGAGDHPGFPGAVRFTSAMAGNLPGVGLIYAITGHDIFGCKLGGVDRILYALPYAASEATKGIEDGGGFGGGGLGGGNDIDVPGGGGSGPSDGVGGGAHNVMPPDTPIYKGGITKPEPGESFSGQMGPPEEAGKHLPHNQLQPIGTVGDITDAGGTVDPEPEPYRPSSPGILNPGHANVTLPPGYEPPGSLPPGNIKNPIPGNGRIPVMIDNGTYEPQ